MKGISGRRVDIIDEDAGEPSRGTSIERRSLSSSDVRDDITLRKSCIHKLGSRLRTHS